MPGANCDHHHKSSSIQFSLEEAAQERVGRCCLPLLTAYDNPACLEISQCTQGYLGSDLSALLTHLLIGNKTGMNLKKKR